MPKNTGCLESLGFFVSSVMKYILCRRGAVAQLVEHPLKVPVLRNSIDVESNNAMAQGGWKILAAPSVAEISALFGK